MSTYVSQSYDLDGDLIRYRFAWGDGIISAWSDYLSSNTSVSYEYSWEETGDYSVRVIAQDSLGQNSTWSSSLNIKVTDTENMSTMPVATIFSPPTVAINQSFLFDGSGCTDPDGSIVSYLWDFGDGTTGTGMSPQHRYTLPGVYTVSLMVVDNDGNQGSVEFIVTVPAASGVSVQKQEGSDLVFYVWIGMIALVIGCSVILINRYRLDIQLFLLNHRLHKVSDLAQTRRIAFFKRPEKQENEKKIKKKKAEVSGPGPGLYHSQNGKVGMGRIGSYDYDVHYPSRKSETVRFHRKTSSLDIDTIKPAYELIDQLGDHYHRKGYESISKEVDSVVGFDRRHIIEGSDVVARTIEHKIDAAMLAKIYEKIDGL
jgi:hypothetical protein